jgi:hypothetical protein
MWLAYAPDLLLDILQRAVSRAVRLGLHRPVVRLAAGERAQREPHAPHHAPHPRDEASPESVGCSHTMVFMRMRLVRLWLEPHRDSDRCRIDPYHRSEI